jgi:hypothetical protein
MCCLHCAQFYHKGILDSAWQRASHLLQSGKLPGIFGIESTTAYTNKDTQHNFNPSQGVLMLYGGTSEDAAGTPQWAI